jgi:hypothetical protein
MRLKVSGLLQRKHLVRCCQHYGLEKYIAVQRSQYLTQADIRIFGADYMAHTSAVDGKGAFLREPLRHDHIAFFQSFARLIGLGFPPNSRSKRKRLYIAGLLGGCACNPAASLLGRP